MSNTWLSPCQIQQSIWRITQWRIFYKEAWSTGRRLALQISSKIITAFFLTTHYFNVFLANQLRFYQEGPQLVFLEIWEERCRRKGHILGQLHGTWNASWSIIVEFLLELCPFIFNLKLISIYLRFLHQSQKSFIWSSLWRTVLQASASLPATNLMPVLFSRRAEQLTKEVWDFIFRKDAPEPATDINIDALRYATDWPCLKLSTAFLSDR